MSVTVGNRLGPYEITGTLGAGGMGEVFRARDTRLGREVAIKVLPAALSASPELRARLEREARTIAGLNHPNICTLHDIGHQDGTDYLVMELVEGETLATRLARGPVPLEELLRIGSEVAAALERAHRAGVVHRDLKPGNVMLTRSGAKLMDFGLALPGLPAAPGAAPSLTALPTAPAPITAEGTIVGTVPYMAPEQLEGREADARTDLWAFGCVLYEMATGRRAFEGATQASLISAIMRDQPRAIAELRPMSPTALDRVVRQCLAKDPDERWQSAGDLRRELQWIAAGSGVGPSAVATTAAGGPRRPWRRAAAGSAIVLALVATAVAAWALRGARGDEPVVQLTLAAEPGLRAAARYAPVLSPDGRHAVFFASDSTEWMLRLRALDATESEPLGRGEFPFFSPDGRWVGYYADGKLVKRAVRGGTPVTICRTGWVRGVDWGRRGVIVFGSSSAGPLFAVDAAGGEPRQVTTLDSTRGESSHRSPSFLPDGERFLFVALPEGPRGYDVRLGSIRGGPTRSLFAAQSAPIYVEPGWLLYIRDRSLVAQRFDPRRAVTVGEPVEVAPAPPPPTFDGAPTFGASQRGHLIYPHLSRPRMKLEWIDAGGRPLAPVPVAPRPWTLEALRPDGRVATLSDGFTLWNLDLERFTLSRVAGGPDEMVADPVWSPDGLRLAYTRVGPGRPGMYVLDFRHGGEPRRIDVTADLFQEPRSWIAGDRVLVATLDPKTSWDLWTVDANDTATARPLVRTPEFERWGSLSPDGRRLAYNRLSEGKADVLVQTVPSSGPPIQLTRGDAASTMSPMWVEGGAELVYSASWSVWRTSVSERGGVLEAGVPRRLFERSPQGGGILTLDGERFLVALPSDPGATWDPELRVVLNWPGLVSR